MTKRKVIRGVPLENMLAFIDETLNQPGYAGR